MAKPVDLTIRVKADTGEVAPGMQKLDNQLDAATKSAKRLDDELGDISAHDVKLDVNTQAVTNARKRIDDLRDDIARMKALDIEADTRQAEQEIAKLRRSIKALSDDTKSTGGDIGHNVTRGLDDANEGMTHFKDESNETAREVAASFDGSAESIAGAFQEVAANALGGFGPAGALAGLGIAAGIGLGIQALTMLAEEANASKQEVIDLAAEIRDAGGDITSVDWSQKFQEFGDTIVDARSWFEPWQESSVTALEKAAEVAEKTGVSFEDMFKGMAGDVPAASRAIKEMNERIAAQQRVVDKLTPAVGGLNTVQGQANTKQREALGELKGYRTELEQAIGTTTEAIERNKLFADAMGMTVEEYARQQQADEDARAAKEAHTEEIKAQEQAYRDLVEGLADPTSVYQGLLADQTEAEQVRAQAVADGTEDSSDSWEDYVTDVAVSTQELIDEWNRQADAAAAFETNLATIAAAGGQALADELRAKGPEVAGAVADVIAHASDPEQEAAFAAYGRATGEAGGQGIADGITSKQDDVDLAMSRIWASLMRRPDYGTGVFAPGFGSNADRIPGVGSAAAQTFTATPVPGNVRIYIDGQALRATVRQDVAAAGASAALVGTSRARP